MIGLGALLAGLAVLLATLACVFAATALLLRGRAPGGSLSVLAHATVATGLVLLVHLTPGALGILDRWTVLAAAVAALALALVGERRRGPRHHPAPAVALSAGSREPPAAWWFGLAGAGLVGGYATVYLLRRLGTPPLGIDALSFHLPGVAAWIHAGSLWGINQFAPLLAHGNYPNNGDVLFLAAMLPLRSALLVRGVMAPYYALLALALYAVGRQLGAGRGASLLFGSAAAAVPAVLGPAMIDTETDTLMLFGLAAGVAFLLAARRRGGRTELVLAGIALGVSFGTKWYAVPCVLVVLAVWAAGRALERPRLSLARHDLTRVLGPVVGLGGFWLLRNLVESGDPVFPLRVAPLGVTLFDAPPDVIAQQGGFTIGNYLLSPHVLGTYILPAIRYELSPVGLLIGAAGVLGGGLALRGARRGGREVRPVAWLALGAVLLTAVYVVTPDSALGPLDHPTGTVSNVRYLMPALVLAAPAAAWLCGRLGRAGLALELAVLTLSWPALTRGYGFASGAAAAAALGLLFGGGLTGWPPARRTWGHLRIRPAVVVVALLAALAVAGLAVRGRSGYATYGREDATVAWLLDHAPGGHTVGLAGVWSIGLPPAFPAFGPRLGNHVSYVGRWVRHLLEPYTDPVAFRAALRRRRIELLEVGLGFPTPRPSVPEEAWARAAGYREVARSPRLALLLAPGRAR